MEWYREERRGRGRGRDKERKYEREMPWHAHKPRVFWRNLGDQ